MKKLEFIVNLFISFIIASCFPAFSNSNNGIIIKVETLSKPQSLLELNSFDSSIKNLLLSENNILETNSLKAANFPYNVIAKSSKVDSMVTYGFHPFFNGMYEAYAHHRPFTLSPDMIWLLISQGFAQHVNNNAEDLRKLFVTFNGKISLVVNDDSISLDDPGSPWEQVFPKFTKQIGDNVGQELVDILTCNFSTTSITEKVASEITILESFKQYFEYIEISNSCGIPEITIKGTPRDWQFVYDKAQALRKYKLDWWIDALDPILLEFIKASKGSLNTLFWRNMFKYHSIKQYGAPNVVDGWIVKFFPYNKIGKRNNLKEISAKSEQELPNEMVKVDLKYIKVKPHGMTSERPLEIWAGFIGLDQDRSNFNLTPKIGWFIRKKSEDMSHDVIKEHHKFIQLRVRKFPDEVLSLDSINYLGINFTDTINIPENINILKVNHLTITGDLATEKLDSILHLVSNFSIVEIMTQNIYILKRENDFRIDTLSMYGKSWIQTKFKSVNELTKKRAEKKLVIKSGTPGG